MFRILIFSLFCISFSFATAESKIKVYYLQKLLSEVSVTLKNNPKGKPLTLEYSVFRICQKASINYLRNESRKNTDNTCQSIIPSFSIDKVSVHSAIITLLANRKLIYTATKKGLYLTKRQDKTAWRQQKIIRFMAREKNYKKFWLRYDKLTNDPEEENRIFNSIVKFYDDHSLTPFLGGMVNGSRKRRRLRKTIPAALEQSYVYPFCGTFLKKETNSSNKIRNIIAKTIIDLQRPLLFKEDGLMRKGHKHIVYVVWWKPKLKRWE